MAKERCKVTIQRTGIFEFTEWLVEVEVEDKLLMRCYLDEMPDIVVGILEIAKFDGRPIHSGKGIKIKKSENGNEEIVIENANL